MKKLMIAAAVAVLGIAANAASIAWSANGDWVDYTTGAVLTEDTAPAGKIALYYLGNTTDGYSYDDAVWVQDATVKFGNSMGTLSAKASGTFILDIAKYKDGDVFGVLFDDGDGNLSKLVVQSTGAELDSPYVVSGFKSDASTLDPYKFATANYAVNVPEPTSGLLLLLGVAGMALRRRRA